MQQQNMVMNPSGMPQRMMRANVNVQGGLRQVCKLIVFTITLHTINYIPHCLDLDLNNQKMAMLDFHLMTFAIALFFKESRKLEKISFFLDFRESGSAKLFFPWNGALKNDRGPWE